MIVPSLLLLGVLQVPAEGPRGYVAPRAWAPMVIDGKLDEVSWAAAPWTEDFVDIEGERKPRPRHRTRAKMVWDDENLYIGALLDEPHVWATITEHDAVIFQDNDFEVFMDPDGDNHNYDELELNALNTTWDLFLPKPYRDGGPAQNERELAGLRTAVHVIGTLNDPTDIDTGWSVEIAIPWDALKDRSQCPIPPRPGDQWRINFSRVQWRHEVKDGKYVKIPDVREDNWVWSPQGVIDMHRPEFWGYLQFSESAEGKVEAFRVDPSWLLKERLMRIYSAQKAFHAKHQRWAATMEALAGFLDGAIPKDTEIIIIATDDGFHAIGGIVTPQGEQRWSVRQDSLLRPIGPDSNHPENRKSP